MSAGPAVWSDPSASAGRDDAVLRDALVAGICLGLPGISVSIATAEGVVWSATDGYADVATRTPLHADDRFCVGSITKTFVAVVTLQLADEGKLDLTATAMDYLSHIPIVADVPNTVILRALLSFSIGNVEILWKLPSFLVKTQR